MPSRPRPTLHGDESDAWVSAGAAVTSKDVHAGDRAADNRLLHEWIVGRVLRVFLEQRGSAFHVLDLGMGIGTLLLQLEREIQIPGLKLAGIDRSQEAVDQASEYLQAAIRERKASLFCAELGKSETLLRFDAKSQNVVIACCVLNYCRTEDALRKFLARVFRLLPMGGHFIVVDWLPTVDSAIREEARRRLQLSGSVEYALRESQVRTQQAGWAAGRDEEWWRALFASTGFKPLVPLAALQELDGPPKNWGVHLVR